MRQRVNVCRSLCASCRAHGSGELCSTALASRQRVALLETQSVVPCQRACSREAGCPCRSPVLWTQCVPAHSVRSSGPTTSSSARYTQRLPPFWPSDQLLLRGQMCAPKHTQAASLTKMYFADRRRQQLGQGPLHRGCRVDRLGLGCRAEGGGELRLPTRYAHTTASGPTLTQL